MPLCLITRSEWSWNNHQTVSTHWKRDLSIPVRKWDQLTQLISIGDRGEINPLISQIAFRKSTIMLILKQCRNYVTEFSINDLHPSRLAFLLQTLHRTFTRKLTSGIKHCGSRSTPSKRPRWGYLANRSVKWKKTMKIKKKLMRKDLNPT